MCMADILAHSTSQWVGHQRGRGPLEAEGVDSTNLFSLDVVGRVPFVVDAPAFVACPYTHPNHQGINAGNFC